MQRLIWYLISVIKLSGDSVIESIPVPLLWIGLDCVSCLIPYVALPKILKSQQLQQLNIPKNSIITHIDEQQLILDNFDTLAKLFRIKKCQITIGELFKLTCLIWLV
jgi:hypothetical protein